MCHGLAGYFDAQLYGDVHLSIHPPTHTANMFSWFPIFFPFKVRTCHALHAYENFPSLQRLLLTMTNNVGDCMGRDDA